MEPLIILNGIFSIIYCIITLITGILIGLKYRKTKQYVFIYIGIPAVLIASSFYPSSISFLLAITTGEGLTETPYFIIGNIFIPIAVLSWMLGMTEFLYKKHRKVIIIIYIVISIIFEIYLIYFSVYEPEVVGKLNSIVDVQYHGLTEVYLLFAIVTTIFTGVHFSIQGIKSDDKKSQIKGKFLIIGFISYVIGIIADGFMTLDFITLPIVRIVLISSAIMYYIGWTLPKPVEKIFIRTE